MKDELVGQEEIADLFAQERDGGLESLLVNLDQSIFGEPAYPITELRAVHLLCFV
jgi:hypothetical protein